MDFNVASCLEDNIFLLTIPYFWGDLRNNVMFTHC